MQRKALVLFVLMGVMLGSLASAQVRVDVLGRVAPMEGDGNAVAALVPIGAATGWGRVEVSDLRPELGLSVEGSVFSLEPWQSYSLLVDGAHLLDLRTNRFGDAEFGITIGGQSVAGMETAAIVDSSLGAVLEGSFVLAGEGGDEAPIAYEDRIDLDDMLGVGAEGMARVERQTDGFQLFETGATGLEPSSTYQVVVDGILAAVVTADQVGQAWVYLAAPDDENPLPPELQPVDDLRLVEWTDANGNLVLAGAFSGNSPTPAVLFGTVESVGDSSFVLLAEDGPREAVTVLVDEHTRWGGTLTGISDLETGMWVFVEGELTGDGSVQAWFVANEEEPPFEPVFLMGTVDSVDGSSFVLAADEPGQGRLVTILVDEETQWGGTLAGIGDLEVGMHVFVEGELTGDDSVLARFVANEEEPPFEPVFVMGTVESVDASSFVLAADEPGQGRLVTILVDDETQWGGTLAGIGDLEVGMHVFVEGEFTGDESVLARFVANEEEPPFEPVFVMGTVDSVDASSFVLATDDPRLGPLVTILVGGETQWGGTLSGIVDLQVGMPVFVEGELTDDGSVQAWFVANEEEPPFEPVFVMGTVDSVDASSFVLATDDPRLGPLVTILVGGETQWGGTLSGIVDLQVGMPVFVEGELTDDGSVQAWFVANEEEPPFEPVFVMGTVDSVDASSFVLATDDPRLGPLVTILVGGETQWGGTLSGIVDLQVGMPVFVEGELTDDGSVQAWFVANEEEPPVEPVFLMGTVDSVDASSFVLATDDPMHGGLVTILVDEETQWGGSVTGITDLQPGMLVHVEGEMNTDTTVRAFLVLGR